MWKQSSQVLKKWNEARVKLWKFRTLWSAWLTLPQTPNANPDRLWKNQNLVDLYCCLTWIHPGLHSKSWGFSIYSQVVYRSGFKNVGGGRLQRQILRERKNARVWELFSRNPSIKQSACSIHPDVNSKSPKQTSEGQWTLPSSCHSSSDLIVQLFPSSCMTETKVLGLFSPAKISITSHTLATRTGISWSRE